MANEGDLLRRMEAARKGPAAVEPEEAPEIGTPDAKVSPTDRKSVV